MSLRTSLLVGIAALAIGTVLPVQADAQDNAPPPREMGPAQPPNATPSPSTAPDQPAAPAPKHTRSHHRHQTGNQSSSTESPQEVAETERLNEQELQKVQAGPQSMPSPAGAKSDMSGSPGQDMQTGNPQPSPSPGPSPSPSASTPPGQ